MRILRAWHINPLLDQTWNSAQPSGNHTLKKQQKRNRKLQKVQRRAARCTTGRFHNTSSVTSMLDHLEWNFLETHRNIAKVTMVYKITFIFIRY